MYPISLSFLLALTAMEAFAQNAPRVIGTSPGGPFEYNPRTGTGRRQPGLIDPRCFSVDASALPPGSPDCNSQAGREWEGIASTDYFTFEADGGAPPNPDIAVGPDDVLTVAQVTEGNAVIARYPNPNAPSSTNPLGVAPVTYSVPNSQFLFPTSRQWLDAWLGESAISELCPTVPRSRLSCQISNATVRYDQMQGRFVVLFTVVDTAIVSTGSGTTVTGPVRKASWVLIASRWATGCQGQITSGGGINIGQTCTPNSNPAAPPVSGNTEFFTTPNQPGPSQSNPNSGGVNSNWIAYWGIPDGSCDARCDGGNINNISDLRPLSGRTVAAPAGAQSIDCASGATPTTVCYFPTSARLGFDNDNITVVSSVYNDNIPFGARSRFIPAFAGTRLRVYKKTAIYTGRSSLNQTATALVPGGAQYAPQQQGDYYDLWDTTQALPYAFDARVARTLPTGATQNMAGLHYEPIHVRGRSLAAFNGNSNLNGQWSAIVGAVHHTLLNLPGPIAGGLLNPQTQLYHRTITYTRTDPGDTPPGGNPPTTGIPVIRGGIPTLQPRASHTVPGFINPPLVFQRPKLAQAGTTTTPVLFVGDDRPQRVISREGHWYVARSAFIPGQANFNVSTGLVPGRPLSTVVYDVVQKLTPAGGAFEVINSTWSNGQYYAPMFDTPANVIQYGSVSPVNLLPYLEKLFVGTTFPPLSPSDPRTFAYGNIAGQALQACKGQEPSAFPPSNQPANQSTIATLAYPGLFDIRCGEDAYDTRQLVRNPVTGGFFVIDSEESDVVLAGFVPFSARAGAATDPNNLGLWMYGAYAKGRQAQTIGTGQWGTYVAHYPLSFPVRDPYNNLSSQPYSDIQPGHPFFTYIQIAKQTEIDPGSRTATGAFRVDEPVRRRDMARWLIRAQMNQADALSYLNATGGSNFSSFADVAVNDPDYVYIETMWRRGYTKGCSATNDGQRRFCPDTNLTRGEMAVFVVRAKMNSVFPTVTSGAFTTTSCQPAGTAATPVGDQFGLYAGCSPYFSDVPNTHIYYAFIQKMRELRISNGTAFSTPASLGIYSPDAVLTRGQLMTFIIRAFFS